MTSRKDDIFEAALNEFSSNSFDDASINTIISQSKTSKGTFYHHFTDKKHLYLALIKQASDAKWKYINEELSNLSDKPPSDDVFELFKQQATYGILFGNAYPRYFELSKRFAKEKEVAPTIYDFVRQELSIEQEDVFQKLFLDAHRNGQFNDTFSIDFITKTAHHLLRHFDEIYFSRDHNLDERLEELNTLIEFLKIGFGK